MDWQRLARGHHARSDIGTIATGHAMIGDGGRDRRSGHARPGDELAPSEIIAWPGKHTLTESIQRRAARADDAGAARPEALHDDAARGVAGDASTYPHRDVIQGAFGAHDIGAVRAHTGPAAAAATTAIGAEAYATGLDVAFGTSTPSLHLAAHEAAHVVQQRAGVQLKGGFGEVGDRYEQHADRVADAVVAGRSAEPILDEMADSSIPIHGGGGVQSRAIQLFDKANATGPAGQGPNTVAGGAAGETKAEFKSYADIKALKISDFISYSDAQADWSMGLTDKGERDELRLLMTWLRKGFQRQSALGDFKVQDLVDGKAELDAIDAYCRGRSEDTPTVPVKAATTMDEIRAWGADIVKLEAVLQHPVLHSVFTSEQFDGLRTAGKIDAFCDYVKTCKPLLHAAGGVEINSYRTLATTDDPMSFKDIKDVRNYHRFQPAALNALRAAQAGNPTNLPFTLILHSAFDHNGAFHQDAELTAVLTAPTNHTIMIEGAEALESITARLPAIVAAHGRDEPDPKDPTKTRMVKRIDQIMLCGHGSSQSIEMAGKLDTDKGGNVKTDSEGKPLLHDDELNLK